MTERSFMAMLEAMNYDDHRSYCTIGHQECWQLHNGVAMLPLEGWGLPELQQYILPYLNENDCYFSKGYLCTNEWASLKGTVMCQWPDGPTDTYTSFWATTPDMLISYFCGVCLTEGAEFDEETLTIKAPTKQGLRVYSLKIEALV